MKYVMITMIIPLTTLIFELRKNFIQAGREIQHTEIKLVINDNDLRQKVS